MQFGLFLAGVSVRPTIEATAASPQAYILFVPFVSMDAERPLHPELMLPRVRMTPEVHICSVESVVRLVNVVKMFPYVQNHEEQSYVVMRHCW